MIPRFPRSARARKPISASVVEPLPTGVTIQDALQVPTDDFAVVCCYFNPAGWESLKDNYRIFLDHMRSWHVPVFGFEAYFGEQNPIKHNRGTFAGLRVVHASDDNVLWQKERMINHTVSELVPAQFTKIAWIDADMLFLDRFWVAQTCMALSKFKVCQLWGRWYHTQADATLTEFYGNVGHLGNNYMTNGGHPGGAWAAQRDVFPLYDTHILGGGDSAMIEGWLGMQTSFMLDSMQPAFRRDFDAWISASPVRGSVTALTGGAVHLYHGSRDNRQYRSRPEILKAFNFDPSKHIRINDNGLLEWTKHVSPEAKQLVRSYFFDRKEDDQLDRPVPAYWFDSTQRSMLDQAKSTGIPAIPMEGPKSWHGTSLKQ